MNIVRKITGSVAYVAISLSFLIVCLIVVLVDEPLMIGEVDYRKYIAMTTLSLFSVMLFIGKYIQSKYPSGDKPEN